MHRCAAPAAPRAAEPAGVYLTSEYWEHAHVSSDALGLGRVAGRVLGEGGGLAVKPPVVKSAVATLLA